MCAMGRTENSQVSEPEQAPADPDEARIAELVACAPRMTEDQAARLRRLYRYGPAPRPLGQTA